METETCDWCGLEFALTGVKPFLAGGDEICLVCWLARMSWNSEAAQEDSPPQT
jgi:hypothetical protein